MQNPFAGAFPKPGPFAKWILIVMAVCAVTHAVLWNWASPASGLAIDDVFGLHPRTAYLQPWALLTSSLVTRHDTYGHAFYALLGLYFVAPALETKWGGWRLVRFLLASVFLGNVVVLLAALNPIRPLMPALGFAHGPMAAVTAAWVAWAREHKDQQIRFMLVFPMSGKMLLWLSIGMAGLYVLFAEKVPEGAVAPVGAVVAGLVLSGNPSPLRALWLRFRLKRLQKKSGMDVESLAGDLMKQKPKARRPGAPALRVVPGGLEDELKKRKAPKDKRYLN